MPISHVSCLFVLFCLLSTGLRMMFVQIREEWVKQKLLASLVAHGFARWTTHVTT